MKNATEMVPGVRATEEFLVFEVDSDINPERVYRVDLSLWWGLGKCSCEDFCCRVEPRLAEGKFSGRTTCKHLDRVHRLLAIGMAQGAIERRSDKEYEAEKGV
jgi:hypothetical protein